MYSLHKIPIGIYEKAIPDKFDWHTKMLIAKEAGFDYMEMSVDETDKRLARLDWGNEEIGRIRKYMEKTGIILPTMCLSGHRRYPFGSKNVAVREKAMEIMEKAILLSVKMGIRCIQLASYDVYYEQSDEETKALFLEGMKRAVEMAEKAGVILAMEIMDTEFVGTIIRAMHYIREIPSPYFKIYPDIGNLSRFSADACTELEIGMDHIVAIHIKETKKGSFKGVKFGEGEVRFAEIFRKLKELDYSGMFLIEMWAENEKGGSMEQAVEYIKNARKFVLEQMLRGGLLINENEENVV